MTSRLILASQSRYKCSLMRRLGVDFDAIATGVDESRNAGETPLELARRLARCKAEAAAAAHPDAFVIGSDQVVSLDSQVFNKPVTAQRAAAQLAELAGKTHDLTSAVALVTPDGEALEEVVRFEMTMRPLTPEQIRAYVAEDEPLDCAGSYRVESAGIRLFEALGGDDYTAVIGLPLTRVWTLLEQSGFV